MVLLGIKDNIIVDNCSIVGGLSLIEASKIIESCVYVIHDGNDIVYIGKTINPKKRFENYIKHKYCHNERLKTWLSGHNALIDLLITTPDKISEIEKYLIRLNKPMLFNITYGDVSNWQYTKNPWVAKLGVKCPSDLLLKFLKNRSLDKNKYANLQLTLNNRFKEMSIFERVSFEVDLAMVYYSRFRNQIEAWLFYTEDRMIKVLETKLV